MSNSSKQRPAHFSMEGESPVHFPLLRTGKCHTSCSHSSPRRRGRPDAF